MYLVTCNLITLVLSVDACLLVLGNLGRINTDELSLGGISLSMNVFRMLIQRSSPRGSKTYHTRVVEAETGPC